MAFRASAYALAPVALMAALVAPSLARADGVQPYARILSTSAVLRTGPAASYNRAYLAERGEVFPVRARSPHGGYWFRVELPDGTEAWVLGDLVHVHEVSDDEASGGRFLPELFAPPALPTATGELAVTVGALGSGFATRGGGGLLAVRPSFLVAPEFGLELTGAVTVSDGGRLFLAALGGIVNLFPNSPIVPYFVTGGGIAHSAPNADSFLLQSGNTALVYGGGGLRFGFRYRITIRLEARAYAFFKPDLYAAQEELSGGLTVFF